MNYIGSKLSLLDFIEDSINKVVDRKAKTFSDLFAGTGAVGTHFKKLGYKVISNDIQYYSFVLNKHYIGNHKNLKFEKLVKTLPELNGIKIGDRENYVCNYLSNLRGVRGFIYKNYCLGGTKKKKYPRQYFSDSNGMKCDAIRLEIEKWRKNELINENEFYFLLTSLLETIDKRANTASVYGAFLKQLKKTAQKSFVLFPAELVVNHQDHEVFNLDVNKLINKIKGDILYLDPPYNQRQYSTNYHVLETIARYDYPKVYGVTGLRNYQDQKSFYCSSGEVKKAFEDLILNANYKYIFLSYNNEGLMSHDDIKEIMSKRGKYGYFKKEYGRFKADSDRNRVYSNKKTFEYLHYVICD
ncbi:MAG TPA: DNA adenine methylase [Parcubacteria group bacterium]|nr:DNA adenine methylase [Parcubacteria group bacterium]